MLMSWSPSSSSRMTTMQRTTTTTAATTASPSPDQERELQIELAQSDNAEHAKNKSQCRPDQSVRQQRRLHHKTKGVQALKSSNKKMKT